LVTINSIFSNLLKSKISIGENAKTFTRKLSFFLEAVKKELKSPLRIGAKQFTDLILF